MSKDRTEAPVFVGPGTRANKGSAWAALSAVERGRGLLNHGLLGYRHRFQGTWGLTYISFSEFTLQAAEVCTIPLACVQLVIVGFAQASWGELGRSQ